MFSRRRRRPRRAPSRAPARDRRSGRPRTRSRRRAGAASRGTANGESAVEAWVIRPGGSIRLSTPPRLSAERPELRRAGEVGRPPSSARRNEIIPPKSRIWRGRELMAGMVGEAGVVDALGPRRARPGTRRSGARSRSAGASARRASSGRAARARSRTGRARAPSEFWRNSSRSATVGSFVPAKPPTTSEWPPRYLVVEWTTMSAPSSSGRCRYGVAKVLSTTTSAPTAWAASRGGARCRRCSGAGSSATRARRASCLLVQRGREVGVALLGGDVVEEVALRREHLVEEPVRRRRRRRSRRASARPG